MNLTWCIAVEQSIASNSTHFDDMLTGLVIPEYGYAVYAFISLVIYLSARKQAEVVVVEELNVSLGQIGFDTLLYFIIILNSGLDIG